MAERDPRVTCTSITTCVVYVEWDFPHVENYSHTEISWGTGVAPPNHIENPPTQVGLKKRYSGQDCLLTGLAPANSYWVRVRHVDLLGQGGPYKYTVSEGAF